MDAITRKYLMKMSNLKFRKLSDFYYSRRTDFPSCLLTNYFIISKDVKVIVNSGFSKTCKAVIKPNLRKKEVRKFFEQCRMRQIQMQLLEQENKKCFEEMKVKAVQFLSDHIELKDRLIEKHGTTSKGLQTVAWKLSNRANDKGLSITKTAMYHCL